MSPDPHGVALAEQLPDGRWHIECDCDWSDTTSSESGALRAFEEHAGPWTMPRTPNQATAA